MSRVTVRAIPFAVLLTALASAAQAQTWPSRTITIIVPVAPGSQVDVFSRMIAVPLAAKLGQNVVVENRPGGGQITGTAAAAKAAPDGHTLFHGNLSSLIISPQIRNPPPYNTPKDFTAVALTMSGPSVLVVDPKLPIKTPAELIAYAKANPGKLNYGSHGMGSFTHVTTEMLKGITGIDMVHVPYAGGGKLIAGYLAGEVQVVIFDLVSVREHEKAGKARVIATVGDQRSPHYPNMPLLSETLHPLLRGDFWLGVAAPAGTPQPIVERLNKEINEIVNTKEFREKGEAFSMYPQKLSPKEFSDKLAREWDSWGKVIRERKIVVR
jgi:tripartite-type tricarboxylate transporter receptor subunit TctC